MNTKLVNRFRVRQSLTLPFATCLLALSCIRADANATTQIQTATSQLIASDYVCVQRSPNSRVWRRAVLETNELGVVRTNLHSYTELATGLCYLQNGHYVDSVEQINLVGNGAEAVEGPCKVQWASDASTAAGSVQLTTPTGQQFTSRVFGLALRDTSTGSNVLIAEITNSTGALVGANQIIYPAAFSGLQADIQDIYRKSGFEQNIVLREQPPSPADYGLNPETTRLEVLTEFFDPPVPTKTTVETDGESDDVNLNFGDMHIRQGTAFLAPGQDNLSRKKVKVSKRWEKLDDGRVYLIEEVPLQAMTNLLQELPPHASTGKARGKVRRTASLKSLLRTGNAIQKSSRAIKVAQAMPQRPGVVIDYTTLIGGVTNYVFQGDTTYYISGSFWIYDPAGTVTFEGGSVIKFTNSGNIENGCSNIAVFKGSPYRPVVFTSSDDDSVGQHITGSSGSPSEGTAIYYAEDGNGLTNVTVANVRFSYAGIAYADETDTGHFFQDCQFVRCGETLYMANPCYISLENILCSQCSNFFNLGIDGACSAVVDAENITVDSCSQFVDVNYVGVSGGITNSILTACDASITNFNMDHTTVAGSSNGVYQTVGAGSYYLANGSTNRNAGTTNIDPALLADLQTKTTYPPVTNNFYTSAFYITNNTTYSPQVQRDTDTPDLGYHYDPIDYAICIQIDNATLTVLPGTALAMVGPSYGIWLYYAANMQCQGTATQPINIFRYNLVQEQSNTNWATYSPYTWNADIFTTAYGSNTAGNFRFVNWSALAGDNFIKIETPPTSNAIPLFGCQLYNGTIDATGPDILATNCLFQRMALTLDDSWWYEPNYHTLYNNLFEGGSFTTYHDLGDAGGFWTCIDNLFDKTVINEEGAPIETNNYNGYVTNCGVLSASGTNNVILAGSPAYQIGWLGEYYYPTNLTNLIHQGSRSASAAGLYHYTVTTNNVIEGTNQVSIGYHYVATDTNVVPLDSNGDGVPDYLEDYNGDGIADDGETNWALAILTQPFNQTAYEGGDMAFAVGAYGVDPLAYQWQFDGTNIIGATNSSVLLTNVNSASVGSYSVTISNAFGSLASSNAILTVVDSFTYQWQFNGINIVGATNSSLALSNVSSAETGNYSVVVSNPFGSTPSSNAALTVVSVASLAPTNNTNCILLNSTVNENWQVWGVPVSTNPAVSNLEIIAIPDPANLPITNLPVGWSLNGALTNITYVSITNPGVHTVICSAGTSAITNVIWVTTNTVTNQASFVTIAENFPGITADYSYDGINWTASPGLSSLGYYWNSVAYGNGMWVAIGANDDEAYSTNGINWTAGPGLPSAGYNWDDVAYGNGMWVVVAEAGNMEAYSTNGINWTANPMPYGGQWASVVFANGMFVALDSEYGSVAYSIDGVYWTSTWGVLGYFSPLNNAVFGSVVYGNGLWVAVGSHDNWLLGAAAYSTDAINWTLSPGGLPLTNASQAAYGNGVFVVIENNYSGGPETNSVAYSTDGTNWALSPGGLPYSGYWRGLTYGSGKFVAIAEGTNGAAFSTDGINWTLSPGGPDTSESWDSVAANDFPAIFIKPASQTNYVGQTTTFTVSASGTSLLTYQWLVESNGAYANLSTGGQFSGVTNTTLTISTLALTNTTNYEVVVTYSYGSITSPVATLTVLTNSSYQTVIMADAPASYWPMQETTGPTIYDVVGGNNGTLVTSTDGDYLGANQHTDFSPAGFGSTDGATYLLGGPGGLGIAGDKAIYFTNLDTSINNSQIVVPYNPAIDPASNLTAEAWIKVPTYPIGYTSTAFQVPLGLEAYGGVENGWWIGFETDSSGSEGDVEFNMAVSPGNWFSSPPKSTSSLAGTWVYVVEVYTGSNSNLLCYTNGVLMADVALTTNYESEGAYGTHELPFIIGSYSSPGGTSGGYSGGGGIATGFERGNFWHGGVSHVAIYTNALTTSQITNHYNNGTNILSAPYFITPLASQTNYIGQTGTFTVSAIGTQPLYYQWQVKSNGIYENLNAGGQFSGVTNTTLTISSLALTNATNYEVVVTNVYGSVTSAVATLTLWTSPYESVILGDAPVSYWPLQETTGPTIHDIVTTNAGPFNGTVQKSTDGFTNGATDSEGKNWGIIHETFTNSTSAVATDGATYLFGGPGGLTGISSDTAIYFTNLNGQLNNAQIAIGTNGTGVYESQLDSSTFSVEAWIMVPTYTIGWTSNSYQIPLAMNAYGNAGGTANGWFMGIKTDSSGSSAYGEMFFDAGTGSAFASNGPSAQVFSGKWVYAVQEYNGTATVIYTNGTLMVSNTQTYKPLSNTSSHEEPLIIGSETAYYFGGSAFSGNTRSDFWDGGVSHVAYYNYALSASKITNHYYHGTNIPSAPSITTQPASQTKTVGQTNTFTVSASGTSPLSYQWLVESNGAYASLNAGGQFSGVTNATLTISSLALTNATNYEVVVTNWIGSVTSSNATLTVNP